MSKRDLYAFRCELSLGDIEKSFHEIRKCLEDCRGKEAWGDRKVTAIGRLFAEVAQNSFQHANGSIAWIDSSDGAVTISVVDSGFGPNELAETRDGGGSAALRSFEHELNSELTLIYRFKDGWPRWIIHVVWGSSNIEIACTENVGQFTGSEFTKDVLEALQDNGCEEFHLYARGLETFSGGREACDRAIAALGSRPLVAHFFENQKPIAKFLQEKYPNVRFVHHPDVSN
jgi:hypothetical protein